MEVLQVGIEWNSRPLANGTVGFWATADHESSSKQGSGFKKGTEVFRHEIIVSPDWISGFNDRGKRLGNGTHVRGELVPI